MCVWAAGFRASPSYARLTVTAALVSYTDRNAADGGALAEQGNAILRDKDSCPNTTGILVAIERQELVKLGDVFSSLPLGRSLNGVLRMSYKCRNVLFLECSWIRQSQVDETVLALKLSPFAWFGPKPS